MDKNRFDGFTRQLAQRENRRQAIKTLLAGGAGTAAALVIGKETEAAKPGGSTACCPADHPALCGLTCTAVATDPNNCGVCGVTCQPGQTCVSGTCTPVVTKCKKAKDCPSGQTCTNGVCTSPTPQCSSANDCPPSSNECKTATCSAGVCGIGNRPLGTPVAQQTAGDCKQNVCDGNGGTTVQPANDPPAGVGVCLPSYTCNGGTAVPQYAPTTTVCSGGFCNGTGTCVQCNTAANCPAGDECKTAVCQNGTCGYTFVSSGTETSAQTAHDCQKNVCDGSGNIVPEADPTDPPIALGECYTASCNGGSPVQQAKAAGTPCSGGTCNGSGTCVAGCASAEECPGTDTFCQNRTCFSGVCGFAYAPDGTPTSSQISGDCHRTVCNGSGGTRNAVDDTDTPTSGPCDTGTCTNGVPSNPPVLPGTLCDGGVCDASGACVDCLTPNDCAGTDTECQTRTCTNGACGMSFQPNGTPTSNQTTGDCKKNVCDGAGNIISVNDNSDVINTHYPEECLETVCSNGSPTTQNKPYGSSCGAGFCNGNNVCLECISDDDCLAAVANATPFCDSGFCSYECHPGFGDCNPGGDGCETNLMTNANHCGTCETVCNLPHATARCVNGACGIQACDQDFADCNGIEADGCEVNVRTDIDNCGSCGNACTGGRVCSAGTCVIPFE